MAIGTLYLIVAPRSRDSHGRQGPRRCRWTFRSLDERHILGSRSIISHWPPPQIRDHLSGTGWESAPPPPGLVMSISPQAINRGHSRWSNCSILLKAVQWACVEAVMAADSKFIEPSHVWGKKQLRASPQWSEKPPPKLGRRPEGKRP